MGEVTVNAHRYTARRPSSITTAFVAQVVSRARVTTHDPKTGNVARTGMFFVCLLF